MEHLNGGLNRKLKMALVGGGQGSFIGRVHSTAAILDNRAELVAGALSSNAERSKASAPSYAISPDRAYGSYQEMLEQELKRPEGDRIDFVTVATPNHMHFPVAKAAAEAGFNVVCDKPLTFTLEEAEELAKIVEKNKIVFAVTHNYTGYPLVRQIREMIQAGEFGEVQAIRSNYIQGWLRTKLEESDQKQAAWRTDPSKSGIAGAFGDIATHAYNLVRYTTGLIPAEISCTLKSFEPGRKLDDYGIALIRFANGGLANITASQITHGRENDLTIEIDGTKAAVSWRQEEPNAMYVRRNGEPWQVYTRNPGSPYSTPLATASGRIPGGHPEAFFEAFANIYRFAYDDMIKRALGQTFEMRNTIYPNVYDGIDGMNFIQQSVASSQQNSAWIPLQHDACR
ncbi:Gfo/Idh/MocA family protein [Planctomicrobium sp. SH527]|uniref:Gfo/Idh/MocA family protein n=1 Tax=Planctomicrobium sp. SH527 TaxID=3448123 RepID=UPI003F5BCC26